MAKGRDAAERPTFAFRLATARPPSADELAILVESYKQNLAQFRLTPREQASCWPTAIRHANEELDVAQQAAWTMVANLILNLGRNDYQEYDDDGSVKDEGTASLLRHYMEEYSAFVQRVLAANAPGHIGDQEPDSAKLTR